MPIIITVRGRLCNCAGNITATTHLMKSTKNVECAQKGHEWKFKDFDSILHLSTLKGLREGTVESEPLCVFLSGSQFFFAAPCCTVVRHSTFFTLFSNYLSHFKIINTLIDCSKMAAQICLHGRKGIISHFSPQKCSTSSEARILIKNWSICVILQYGKITRWERSGANSTGVIS